MSFIRFHELEFDDAFCFGKGNKVILDEAPVTQIIAKNGLGKSSIPLILEEALFNKNSKGVAKGEIPNRYINEGYNIKCSFSKDNVLYQVHVKRASSLKITLKADGEDISSHTATNTFKSLGDILGWDFKTFQQLVNQTTTSSLAFLTATDTNRKKFLIDLFDMSEYVEKFNKFKEAATDVAKDLERIKGKSDTITKWLDSNKELDLTLVEEPEIPSMPDTISEKKKIEEEIKAISFKNSKISSNNGIREHLSTIDIESLRSDTTQYKDTDECTKEIAGAKIKLSTAESTVSKLSKLKDTCPTCLQSIDKEFYNNLLDKSNQDIAYNQNIIDKFTAELKDIKSNNLIFQQTQQEILEYEKLEAKLDLDLEDQEVDLADLEAQLQEITKNAQYAQKRLAEATRAYQTSVEHNSRIKTYLEQNKKFEEELAEVQKSLPVLNQRLNRLETLKKVFSTNGLIAYKLENLIKDLEEYTNTYLAELSDGRFAIEFVIEKDKLNIDLTDNGKSISVLSPSSGEMARINTSILLGIRKLMSGVSKNTTNLLFLDEVISVLDDFGKERLVEILLEEQNLNTFVVSHGWSHPLLNKLTITSDEGISILGNG